MWHLTLKWFMYGDVRDLQRSKCALPLSQPILNINASGGYLPLHLNGNSLEKVLMELSVAILL